MSVAVAPRFGWAPESARGLGRECCEFWEAAGGRLLDWQADAIERILRLDDDERWATTDDGICVARQNGKGVILQAVEVFFAFEFGHAFGYDLVMHTAHEVPTALEHQLRLEEIIQTSHLHGKVRDVGGYRHANGQESIRLKDGTRIVFRARTRGGARGYSGDLLVWDEAMEIPDHVVGAQKPTTRASTAKFGPKTLYAGSAVDQTVHLNGRQFALIRKRGIERSQRVSWTEYSAPFAHPDDVTADEIRDRSNWRAANPSLGTLIREETMADEIETIAATRTVLVELLGVGDWPDPDDHGDRPVSLEAWDGRLRPDSRLVAPYVVAFDVSPRRWTAVALAGRNQDGKYHVEVQEFRQGTSWVGKYLARVYERNGADIFSIVCDGVGPAASLLVELEELGIPVDTMNAGEVAESCGRFVDLVAEQEIEHLGSAEIRDALAGAATRPLGDRWAWKRISSRADIAPLVAGTLALGAAAGISVGEVMIY